MEKRNQFTIIQSSDSVDSGVEEIHNHGSKIQSTQQIQQIQQIQQNQQKNQFQSHHLFLESITVSWPVPSGGSSTSGALRFGFVFYLECRIKTFKIIHIQNQITKISIETMMLQSHSQSETLTHIHWHLFLYLHVSKVVIIMFLFHLVGRPAGFQLYRVTSSGPDPMMKTLMSDSHTCFVGCQNQHIAKRLDLP